VDATHLLHKATGESNCVDGDAGIAMAYS